MTTIRKASAGSTTQIEVSRLPITDWRAERIRLPVMKAKQRGTTVPRHQRFAFSWIIRCNGLAGIVCVKSKRGPL